MFLFHSWRKTNSIVKVVESTLCHQVPALPTRGQTPEAKKLQPSRTKSRNADQNLP